MNLIDTNVLLDYPKIILKMPEIKINMSVLRELDELKNKPETSKKARIASKYILDNADKIYFSNPIKKDNKEAYCDSLLLEDATCNGDTIITNDINLLIRCKFCDVKCQTYYENEEDYTGIVKLYVGENDKEISEIYSNEYYYDLKNNQYIFIFDEDKKCVDILQYKNGKINKIPTFSIPETIYSKEIKARNPEQKALMNSLFDKTNTIVYAGGPFGSGKSFLLASYALHQLITGKINKIVFVPNNSQNENTRELGALPGDLFEKEIAYMGTFVDIVGSMLEVKRMYDAGELEIMPISLARGRNLKDCIIIVNEAQNLTKDHIKLLLGRCAEGTRIFFDGDIKQTDKNIFREQNGLKLLTCLKDSEDFSPLFSMVKLESIERSKTAQAAQYLEEIE